jgi:HNH endonuclease
VRRRSLRARLEERARGRCEYCQAPQSVCGYHFHLEHIVPITRGGFDAEANRALACASCNLAKADRISGRDPLTGEEVPLFHPRIHLWQEHFSWSGDHRTLMGRTATGRATIAALDMNSELRLDARHLWFAVGLLP